MKFWRREAPAIDAVETGAYPEFMLLSSHGHRPVGLESPLAPTVGAMNALLGTRHVKCDGAFNIRDLGGYPTTDGSTTRWRTLYRADGLHRVGPGGAERLAELGWQTVLDLRTFEEVEFGTYECQAAEVVHLPVLRQTWDGEMFDATDNPVTFLVDRYLEMLDEGAAAFATAMEILAAEDRRPAAFHCSAGKDRTGVLAAMVLAVTGVSDETIATDYALSAPAMDRIVDWYRLHRPEAVDRMAQQPQSMLACPEEAMLDFLVHLREQYGSVEGYLIEAGTSPAALRALRSQLVVI